MNTLGKNTLLCLLMSLCAPAAFTQAPLELSLSAGAGPGLSAEPGYPALPQALLSGSLNAALGDPFFFVLEPAGSWMSPSSFSAMWMRYRGFGFFSLRAGGGWRFMSAFGPLELSLLAGGNLARYDLSYSYFFFPSVTARIKLPPFLAGPALDLAPTLSLPVLLRADATSAGIELDLRLSWRPFKRPSIVPSQEERTSP